MSTPVVVIGFILLIPSAVVLFFGAALFCFVMITQNTGTAIVTGGFAVIIGISSFVGGLLGWLLVMKKRVLQCSVCGAVVNAS